MGIKEVERSVYKDNNYLEDLVSAFGGTFSQSFVKFRACNALFLLLGPIEILHLNKRIKKKR